MTKEDILQFIDNHTLAVLATTGPTYPQSACLKFGNDGFTIVIDTKESSRKYTNMLAHPEVSMVIGWDEAKTVQLEGTATLLEAGEELGRLKEAYFKKCPDAQKWADKPGLRYFKIEPTWLRYTDLNCHPWDITEFTF